MWLPGRPWRPGSHLLAPRSGSKVMNVTFITIFDDERHIHH
jgi:hypothetical protein